MLSSLLGAGTWHTALEKFLLHAQLTVTVLPGRGSAVPGEVFGFLFFFLELFVDQGSQREADLKYIYGFAKRVRQRKG